MKSHLKTEKGYDFTKKNKVTIWASNFPYIDIPDEYFEEIFSHKGQRARNQWSSNYQLRFFVPEHLETNGSTEDLIDFERAVGECSFSESFIKPAINKARQNNLLKVSWVILLFDYEYSTKTTGILNDQYTHCIGAFTYDEESDSVYEVD
ncbi:immunity 22 family protein [Aliikangiella sp. G2MR2-5]|uniref:immunity 22 family protein n=1 Tax=Aliikangiella sp. G2MR2-5 TaxID=2788943 RepID=UPI0018AAEE4B|nr:immunity 22 family protein [Aliikangiella sp. G2MR2-5]